MWNFIEEDPAAEVEFDPDDGTPSLDCFLRTEVMLVFETSKSMYYLYDTDGCLVEEISSADMPVKWRKKFEKEIE